ncbi:MAG: GNAT family N-acetyltransferase [Ignavibacteria bacterium]|nr:GNAT family N-acetyltransferase [Ignavibacteria bacterium]
MNEKIFDAFPVLKTDRLLLRQLNENDVDGIYNFYSDPVALKYVPRNLFTKRIEASDKIKFFNALFDDRKGIWWAISYNEKQNIIGIAGFFEIDKDANKAELGYGFLQGNWGKGAGTEVVKALTEFGIKEMKLHKIYAFINPENISSIKVVEKFGYKREGLFKDHDFAQNKYFDTAVYTKIIS